MTQPPTSHSGTSTSSERTLTSQSIATDTRFSLDQNCRKLLTHKHARALDQLAERMDTRPATLLRRIVVVAIGELEDRLLNLNMDAAAVNNELAARAVEESKR